MRTIESLFKWLFETKQLSKSVISSIACLQGEIFNFEKMESDVPKPMSCAILCILFQSSMMQQFPKELSYSKISHRTRWLFIENSWRMSRTTDIFKYRAKRRTTKSNTGILSSEKAFPRPLNRAMQMAIDGHCLKPLSLLRAWGSTNTYQCQPWYGSTISTF